MTRQDWARKVISREAERIGSTSHGRHTAVYAAAAACAPYVRDGVVSADEVATRLEAAAAAAGLQGREAETRRTIRDALSRAEDTPAWYPTEGGEHNRPRRVRWRGKVYDLEPGRSVLSALPTGAVEASTTTRLAWLRVTLYAGLRTTAGKAVTWTWTELAGLVAEPEPWPEGGKAALPLWSAAEIEGDDRARRPDGLEADGRERMREPAVLGVHALVLDYDDDPEWSIDKVREWWGDVCYIAHTSAHHMVPKDKSPALPRGRVVVALSRVVTEAEYGVLAEWCLSCGRGRPGRQELANPRRAYFVPAVGLGGYEYDAHLVDAALDVDAILASVARLEVESAADDLTPHAETWAGLTMGSGDDPKPILGNVAKVLRTDPRWRGRLAWDEFVGTPTVDGRPITDEAETQAVEWLGDVYRLHVQTVRAHEAMRMVAAEHARHPVREYLRRLVWDGTERLDYWLVDCLGCADDVLSRAYGRRWITAAVARVMEPGAKVDEVLVLRGRQGVGKSRALRALVPESNWFSDSSLPIGNKDGYQQLRGVWIYELGELDSVRRADWSAIKAFLSAQSDNYRASYARNPAVVPRQVVFAGTTNESTFLGDSTGQRRWWVRDVGVSGPVRPELVVARRDQLWAEAMAAYDAGERWHLSHEEADAQEADAQRYRQADPWEEIVAAWTQGRRVVTTSEVLAAIGRRPEDATRGDEMRVAAILASLGRTRAKVGGEGTRRWAWVADEP